MRIWNSDLAIPSAAAGAAASEGVAVAAKGAFGLGLGAGALRMGAVRATVVLTAALVAFIGVIGSPLRATDLEAQYVLESRLLENELERYVETRNRESQAIQEVRSVAGQLDDVLADPNARVAEMRELEVMFTAARETAYLRLKETAEARQRMYDRMDRLAEIALGMEVRQPEPAGDTRDGPEGLWRFHFKGVEVYALAELSFQTGGVEGGWSVYGTYRTSNGHSGDLRGTFRGNQLALEVIDDRRGKVAGLSGAVDAGGRLEGTWNAVETEMYPDRPRGGVWTAHRVSSESDVQLD